MVRNVGYAPMDFFVVKLKVYDSSNVPAKTRPPSSSSGAAVPTQDRGRD